MNRAKVLFVDDEVAVLNGLRDCLRKERKVWDMAFAVGGHDALVELEKAPYDIVVSDMRMPRMDGAELLTRIKASYPKITRLILSGHSEREALIRALPVAHQFLSKPCEAAVLRSTIARVHALRSLLANESIHTVVGAIERLPSVPRTYAQLTQIASDPRKGVADIAVIVQSDPAMSVKVLQLVNSAYFGHARNVTSVQHAVGLLGIDLIKGLALTANAFSAVDNSRIDGFSFERLQAFSIASAKLARSMFADPARSEEAFTAALVHDIGKIVLALGMPEQLGQALQEARATNQRLYDVERRMLGVTHAEVGAYLLGVWGLPFSIVESTAWHHEPRMIEEPARQILAAVHVADALIDEVLEPGEEPRLDMPFLEAVGFANRLPELRNIARECVRGTARA